MKISLLIVKLPDVIQKFFPSINYMNYQNENKIFFSKDCGLSSFFHDDEIRIINQFTTFKRQIEWICGRLVVKHQAELYTGRKYKSRGITISIKESGAPFLSAFPCWGISISHSNEYALGAICYKNNKRIGVDIEKIAERRSDEFINLAFTGREIEELKNKPPADVYRNWTIKESFLKLIEMGFNESLKRVEVINNQIFYYNLLLKNITVRSETIDDDYIYSLVIHNKNEDYTLETGILEPPMLEVKKLIAVA